MTEPDPQEDTMPFLRGLPKEGPRGRRREVGEVVYLWVRHHFRTWSILQGQVEGYTDRGTVRVRLLLDPDMPLPTVETSNMYVYDTEGGCARELPVAHGEMVWDERPEQASDVEILNARVRRRVRALARLSAAQIVAVLERRGIRGIPGNDCACVIALLLEGVPRPAGVYLALSVSWSGCSWEADDGLHRSVEQFFPWDDAPGVKEFLARFDGGEYPHLVVPGHGSA